MERIKAASFLEPGVGEACPPSRRTAKGGSSPQARRTLPSPQGPRAQSRSSGCLPCGGGGGGSAQHPLRPTSEPAPAAWAERTWGGEVLWRRLVDICSNSKSQGFLLALAQQAPAASRGWVGSLPPLEGTPKKNLSKGAPSRSEALRALRPTCPKPLRSAPHPLPPPVSSGPILSGQRRPCSDGPALGYGGPRARVCIYGALALALRFQVVFLRSSNNKLVILSLLVSFWLPCFLPSCPRPRPCPCPCLSFPRSLLLYGPHLRRASVARPRGSASHRGCQAGPSDPDRPFPQGAWRDLREVFPALVLPACDRPSWLESSSSYQVFGQNQSGSQGKPKAEVQETSWEKAHREGRGGSPRCHLCPAFPARRAVTRPGPQSPGRDGASLFPAQPRKQPSPQEISE